MQLAYRVTSTHSEQKRNIWISRFYMHTVCCCCCCCCMQSLLHSKKEHKEQLRTYSTLAEQEKRNYEHCRRYTDLCSYLFEIFRLQRNRMRETQWNEPLFTCIRTLFSAHAFQNASWTVYCFGVHCLCVSFGIIVVVVVVVVETYSEEEDTQIYKVICASIDWSGEQFQKMLPYLWFLNACLRSVPKRKGTNGLEITFLFASFVCKMRSH